MMSSAEMLVWQNVLLYRPFLLLISNHKHYIAACKSGEFSVGHILFFCENGKIIANFPTKNKWREKSQYSYIEDGLKNLIAGIEEKNISSIAIPPLGCGNGGLDWNIVKKMITNKFQNSSVDIIVYEPSKRFTPKKRSILSRDIIAT